MYAVSQLQSGESVLEQEQQARHTPWRKAQPIARCHVVAILDMNTMRNLAPHTVQSGLSRVCAWCMSAHTQLNLHLH
jgi:hypothetical protein